MNVEELFDNIMKLRNIITNDYCFINGKLLRIYDFENSNYEDFKMKYSIEIPTKLYKYFNNIPKKENEVLVNYSVDNLKNNTIYLNTPLEFDDPYDCDLSINVIDYRKERLLLYCKYAKISIQHNLTIEEMAGCFLDKLSHHLNDKQTIDGFFCFDDNNLSRDLNCKKFLLSIQKNLIFNYKNKIDCDPLNILYNALDEEYMYFYNNAKEEFRVACFTTSPYSQLMWAKYANNHKGFCVEYEVDFDITNQENLNLIFALFPVAYSKVRGNITKQVVKTLDYQPDEDYLWSIFSNGILRKSIDWAYQNEWRLVMHNKLFNQNNYLIKFFKITKVFLGNKMPAKDKMEIINICKEKNITVVRVEKNEKYFEMEECNIDEEYLSIDNK